ncbi:MAG: electron transport complex subunit RsxC [Calditrichales bacterium]|nr:MAG: electron transport complex subunit RsxC [Calditrichales bacterium]
MGLPTFKKGVHPQDNKFYTNQKAIEYLPLPGEVFIPLQQHIGVSGDVLVEKDQEVKTGQVIGRSEKFVSAPVHSPVTGKVKAIDQFLHPIGAKVTMIHIERTAEVDDWEKLTVPANWESASADELRKLIWNAGIVGLGGAAFPTHVKLSPPKEKKIDTFILNGVECEPFLTADHRAMLEFGEKILSGMSIIMKILGTDNGFIGIENNKPDAIEAMQKLVADKYAKFKVVPLKVKYPQGAEKMLIEAVIHRKVPAGGLPMDVGAVVNNVGTALAISEAVIEGKPLVERIVTISGSGINEPKNLMVRLGTPFRVLLDACGGVKETTTQIYMGGPMMGFAQHNLDVPVVKATSGIICSVEKAKSASKIYPCIHCGECVSVCPMNLLPTRISSFAENNKLDEAEEFGIMNCIECGSCSFVCPSHIPLVQWIRVGKLQVSESKRKKVA